MKVYAALADDVSNGHVWLTQAGLPARCIVTITNGANQRTVYCEALQFDKNFLAEYNDPSSRRYPIETPDSSIVLSHWYRARLGDLKTQNDYPLTVVRAKPLWGQLRACMQHPQVVVRVAVWLGLLSVALGALGAIPLIASIVRSACGLTTR